MPLDVLGRTRATLKHSTSPPRPTGLGNLLKLLRDGDRLLQLLIFNEEFLVRVVQQTALITSLPLVHTARRCYRLDGSVRHLDCGFCFGLQGMACEKFIEHHHLEEAKVVTRFP